MRKKKLCLIVCGNGAFARAIMGYKDDRTVITVKFKPGLDIGRLPRFAERRIVVVHVGTGREFAALLAFCEKWDIPIIQASTGQKRLSRKPGVPVIECPNLGLTIIAFLNALPVFIKALGRDPAVRIVSRLLTESHQSEKKTVAGTARKIARIIKIKANNIISLRKLNEQLCLGVPMHHLGRHAYHLLTLGFVDGIHIEIKTKVHGLGPYASGAAMIAYRIIVARNAGRLKAGYQSVARLVK